MLFVVVSSSFPQPDVASGDLRLFSLLSILAREHEVIFCALDSSGNALQRSTDSIQLKNAGISVSEMNLLETLRCSNPDVVFFEFYHLARREYIALIERHCPKTKIIIDSVDVHFNRMQALAQLTRSHEDNNIAKRVKRAELAAYSLADIVIAVSEDDRALIRSELPHTRIEVLPNIHKTEPFPDLRSRRNGELLFIGGFRHTPNVDAILYFCADVLPLITPKHPDLIVNVIGSHAPPEVQRLASQNTRILGHIPDIAPYLQQAHISIAPLRYGGGLKGKVGEAMAYGLPVVTTSYGAEGFGLEAGRDLLVGDTPDLFAEHILHLLRNKDLYCRIAKAGYRFINENYSPRAAEQRIHAMVSELSDMQPRHISIARRTKLSLTACYERHIGWRFRRA